MKDQARIQIVFDPLMDDGRVTLKLYLLASNIKKRGCWDSWLCLTFLWSYEKKNL